MKRLRCEERVEETEKVVDMGRKNYSTRSLEIGLRRMLAQGRDDRWQTTHCGFGTEWWRIEFPWLKNRM
jgi:hypothetical protein